MKFKVIVIALFVLSVAAACTQKTCPTYAKHDVQVEKKSSI
jgi:hypothetical protein